MSYLRHPGQTPGVGELGDALVYAIADAVVDRIRRDKIILEMAHPPAMNATQAAEFLGTSSTTVTNEAKAGRLPHLRVGTRYRFSQESLARMLAGEPVELIAHDHGAYIADRLTDLARRTGLSEVDIALLAEEHAREAADQNAVR